MADTFSRLRSIKNKLTRLNESEADAISSVRDRFKAKREELEAEQKRLLAEVAPS